MCFRWSLFKVTKKRNQGGGCVDEIFLLIFFFERRKKECTWWREKENQKNDKNKIISVSMLWTKNFEQNSPRQGSKKSSKVQRLQWGMLFSRILLLFSVFFSTKNVGLLFGRKKIFIKKRSENLLFFRFCVFCIDWMWSIVISSSFLGCLIIIIYSSSPASSSSSAAPFVSSSSSARSTPSSSAPLESCSS